MNYSLYARGEDAFCGPERETAVGASRSVKRGRPLPQEPYGLRARREEWRRVPGVTGI